MVYCIRVVNRCVTSVLPLGLLDPYFVTVLVTALPTALGAALETNRVTSLVTVPGTSVWKQRLEKSLTRIGLSEHA